MISAGAGRLDNLYAPTRAAGSAADHVKEFFRREQARCKSPLTSPAGARDLQPSLVRSNICAPFKKIHPRVGINWADQEHTTSLRLASASFCRRIRKRIRMRRLEIFLRHPC